jgi:CheY-like chemotaxis protein
VQAEDGIGAVQAVFAHQPDAVVLDVQMPRVSGFIAVRVLKDDWQTADIPVVMLTSLDAASDRYWADQSGVDHYLTKDFAAGELTEAIDGVLAAAATARGGTAGDAPRPGRAVESDVLARVCDLLDRKLFESSVAQSVTAIAATARGLEASVAALLGVLQRFVGYDLAAVLLAQERTAYVAVGKDTVRSHYDAFLAAAADAVSSYGGAPVSPQELSTRVAEAGGTLVPAGGGPAGGSRVGRDVDLPVHAAARSRRDGWAGARALQCHPQRLRGDRAVHPEAARGTQRHRHRQCAAVRRLGSLAGVTTALNPLEYRRVVGRFATGITVVTTSCDGRRASAPRDDLQLLHVRLVDPVLVLFCAEKVARFHDVVLGSGSWAVSCSAPGRSASRGTSRCAAGSSRASSTSCRTRWAR